ncbi:UNVERIFIED_CONTAM: Cullin-1 [Sesamum radiatum]|uniref:Cullin-1 n=1 Tax=Sesamum radiatum TaxID=300843 RepID=A0AAW2W649_SESRA
MAAGAVRPLTFEEAWPFLEQEAINRIIDGLDGVEKRQFTSEEYMRIYTWSLFVSWKVIGLDLDHDPVRACVWQLGYGTDDFLLTVYNVCEPNPFGPEVQKLYDQYKRTFEDYISSKAYGEMNDQVRDAILSLIDREREGEEIDKGIITEAINIYVEIGEGSRKYYVDFEEAMKKATTAFYSRKALDWITNQTHQDYMLKVEECLNQEKGRVSDYLKFRSKYNIVEIVQHELLLVHASKLEEKKRVQEVAA